MRIIFFQLVILFLTLSRPTFAQAPTKLSYFGIRAGFLQTATSITRSQLGIDYGAKLVGVAGRNSFYGGFFYQRHSRKLLAYRLEVNYQQKGLRKEDEEGNLLYNQPFHYIGATPFIGITPLAGLSLFVGPEANLRIASASRIYEKPTTIEMGLSGRVSYRYKWIGLEVSYFNALNYFNTFEYNPIHTFDLKNRTWQAGLFFALKGQK